MQKILASSIVLGVSFVFAACAETEGYVLNFPQQQKSIVLQGTNVDALCTPAFKDREAEEEAWREADKNAATFNVTHCPEARAGSGTDIRRFSYYTDTGTFREWNPGGYEEIGLYTTADLQELEKELTQEPREEDGLILWRSCEKGEETIAENLIAKTLTCTDYRRDVPGSDTTKPPKTYHLIPNTDCFLPVTEDLYLGLRIPMSAMDAGIDGCNEWKQLGIQSVRLM